MATGEKWGVADGENGGARNLQTYILVANTSSAAAVVSVTLIFEDGTTAVKTYQIAGNSRFNVQVPAEFPASRGRRSRPAPATPTSHSFGAGAPTPAEAGIDAKIMSLSSRPCSLQYRTNRVR